MKAFQLSTKALSFIGYNKTPAIFLILLVMTIGKVIATPQDSINNEIVLNEWLTVGPFEVAPPAFHNEKNLDGKHFKAENLLSSDLKMVEQPIEGKLFLNQKKESLYWKKQKTNKNDALIISKSKQADYAINWQSTYFQNQNYTNITIEIETPQCFILFVDGEKKLSNLKFSKKDKDIPIKKKELNLDPGKHLIVIVSLYSKNEETNWKIKAKIFTEQTDNITISTDSKHFMNMELLLEGQRLKGASLSPDGKFVMLNYIEVFPPEGKSEKWFEVQERINGNIKYSSRGREMNQAKWSPSGHQISYTSKLLSKNTIEVLDLDNFTNKILLQNKKDFNDHTWSKDGTFIIYSITEEPKKKEKGVYKVEGMPDRWPWWRSRTQLFKLNTKDLTARQLTYGHLSNNLHDISPDGGKILISHDYPDFSERPYSKQVLMELSLSDMNIDTIWEKHFGGSASYSPDGRKLLVTGSPVLFGDEGKNVRENSIPNDYDTQVYIYDLSSGEVDAISKDFNPSIRRAWWNTSDRRIYCIGQDRTYRKAYIFDPEKNTFTDLGANVDIVKTMDFSTKEPIMVYTGSSISYPTVCFDYELKSKKQTQIADPEKIAFKDIKFGKNEDWNFKNETGVTIEGRVYYPPDFNPEKKYPLIVYYYGGTSPTDRTFRGRYPKNLFAAMGYVVYVLQPSGATGYGQEFSALHVNNWGITVADEIILGTTLFLKEHTFINPESVGCLGASYGGFMTMLLTTRTAIFAAAISHAGISSISSYWGEGFWGYSYSSVASANSFPWNNRELYIEQSPLFHADKVTTPLLLLHGDADTNVPPGESIQMYTALKLLGKEVELIEVKGQNHHITDYKKRILWQKTIFAWFDKWLKEDSSWWDALYPEKNL